jgi:hypothetical protein
MVGVAPAAFNYPLKFHGRGGRPAPTGTGNLAFS